MHRWNAASALVLAVLTASCVSPSANASPLTFQVTNDTPLYWRAVMSGQLDHSKFPYSSGEFRWQEFVQTGSNWSFVTLLDWSATTGYYIPVVQAQHLVAPHAGEVAPGLLFEYRWYYLFLERYEGDPTWTTSIIHPGSDAHYDILRIHIDDLAPNAPGLLDPTFGQLSATYEIIHSPEPAGSSLTIAGLAALVIIGVARKYRSG